MINDGNWHSIEELVLETGWAREQVMECAKKLADGRLIHFDEDKNEVRVQGWLINYARSVWEEPGKKNVGSVILSPKSIVKLQETEVENLLNLGVEISFVIVDEKLKHITIERCVQEKE